MPQQPKSNHPHEFVWSIDAQPLDLKVIDEEGGPRPEHVNLICVVDELSRMIIGIRIEPSFHVEEPDSPQ